MPRPGRKNFTRFDSEEEFHKQMFFEYREENAKDMEREAEW